MVVLNRVWRRCSRKRSPEYGRSPNSSADEPPSMAGHGPPSGTFDRPAPVHDDRIVHAVGVTSSRCSDGCSRARHAGHALPSFKENAPDFHVPRRCWPRERSVQPPVSPAHRPTAGQPCSSRCAEMERFGCRPTHHWRARPPGRQEPDVECSETSSFAPGTATTTPSRRSPLERLIGCTEPPG